MTKLNVYLNFAGETEAAFEFYQSVFGGELSPVTRFKDMPIEGVDLPEEEAGKVMHVSLPIGESDVLMATDTLESLGQELVPGNNVQLSVHPDSKEEAERIFHALSSGGEIGMPLADQAWGDYYGDLTDKFGVHWMVNYTYPEE